MTKPLGASYWKQLAAKDRQEHLRPEIRAILVCPDDDSPLTFREAEGDYWCETCTRVFKERGGVLEALSTSDQYQLSAEDRARLEELGAAAPPAMDPADAFGPLWEHVWKAAGEVSGKRVLDVCCGTGWAAAEFAARGAVACGVDAIAGAGGLASAAELRAERGVKVDLVQADIVRLPFAVESFDIVFIARALHTLTRPERLMMEVGRVLKRDGVLINIGEPVEKGGGPGIGRTDPRREGRTLTLADYEGIYREGRLNLTPVLADDSANGAPPAGFVARVRNHFRQHSATGERLFIGRRMDAPQEKPIKPPKKK